MLISTEKTYFHGVNPFTLRDKDEVSDRSADDSFEGSIPLRYRNGLGGINIEQVKRDQRRARQEFVRAMIRRLAKH